IAILPVPTVRRELEIGSLKALHLDGVRWVRPLGIVQRRQKELTTAAKRFLELLHESPESFYYAGTAAGSPKSASASA
ncbi:MAG TPA: LysR substrate-binding domain-containing protein, partial [Planctomycetaceae bacterium]|nr:LysR substrate-binding domain-containing protein [Planctomycetaceae bacterium]